MGLTYGLLFLIANGLYLLFSILVGVSIYFLLKKKWWVDGLDFLKPLIKYKGLISTTVFLIVLLAPFYDLLIQIGIKTYYQNFKMNDTIYAYPEKDADGKIESLGVATTNIFPIGFFLDRDRKYDYDFNSKLTLEKMQLTKHYNYWYKNFIQNYIELGIEDDMEKIKLFHINYKKNEIIAVQEQYSRFKINGIEIKGVYNLYINYIYEFKDMKKNEKLATAWFIKFQSPKDNFRYKFLFWHGANGIPFSIKNIGNEDNIFKKLFGFTLNISGHLNNYNKNGEIR